MITIISSKILSEIPPEALVEVVLSQKAEAAVAATLVLGARATGFSYSFGCEILFMASKLYVNLASIMHQIS